MWKQQNTIETTNLARRFAVTFVITALLCDMALGLSNKRLCADEKCERVISMGRSLITYPAGEKGMVSFKINSDLRIKSKSAGTDPSLWGVVVNGREGYAPKKFIQETKVFVREEDLRFEVDVVQIDGKAPTATNEPVLNASETPKETTTSRPVQAIKNAEAEATVNSSVKNASNELPQAATPVQHETIVDGTRLPTMANSVEHDADNEEREQIPTSSIEGGGEYEDDDDDEIGDYDEDKEDDEEEEFLEVNNVRSNSKDKTKTAEVVYNSKVDVNATAEASLTSMEDKAPTSVTGSHADVSQEEEALKLNAGDTVTPKATNNITSDEPAQFPFSKASTEAPNTSIVKDNETATEPHSITSEGSSTKSTDTVNEAAGVAISPGPEITNATGGPKDATPTLAIKVNSTEETALNNTNNETLPAGDVEENLIEKNNISTQSSLPDSKVVDVKIENSLTENNVIPSESAESKSQVNTASAEDNSMERAAAELKAETVHHQVRTQSTEATLPGDIAQTAGNPSVQNDTLNAENVQVNTNQYSSLPTQLGIVQNNTDPIPSPQTTENSATDNSHQSQLIKDAENVQINKNQYPSPPTQPDIVQNDTDPIPSPQTKENTATDNSQQSQLTKDAENVQINTDQYLSPPTQLGIVQSNTGPIPSPQTTENSAIDNSHQSQLTKDVGNVQINKNQYPSPPTEPDIGQNDTDPIPSPQTKENTATDNSHQSQLVKDTENVQVNTDQYSSPPTQLGIVQSNINHIPSPQTTENSATHNSHKSQLIKDAENVQINKNQYSSPPVQPDIVQSNTDPIPPPQTTENTATDNNHHSHFDQSIETQAVHKETPGPGAVQTTNQHPSVDTQIPSHHYVKSSNIPLPQYDNTSNPSGYEKQSNTPLPSQNENTNSPTQLPKTTEVPHFDYYDQRPKAYAPADAEPEVTTPNPIYGSPPQDPSYGQPSYAHGTVEELQPLPTTSEPPKHMEEPKVQPSLTPSVSGEDVDKKENKGLFATIMDTVNNILPNNKKAKYAGQEGHHNELDRILFPDMETTNARSEEDKSYCEKLGPNDCPHSAVHSHPPESGECKCSLKSLITTEFTLDTFAQALAAKILEISELLAFLAIVAATSLFFIFGYYCFCNSSSEGALLSKLNQLGSSLLASHKENSILKHNLMSTRQKLASIEDNSFGSNDMVVSLKKELEEELLEKARLQEQIVSLQKELENAADAGIELNKIVSELLSNQTGDESIISSVEELQKQLNEQQNTILEINASLAEKSRENSELQLLIAEQNARYESQISNLQRDNDELEAEKDNLQSRLEEIKNDFDKDITAALESKNFEIKRLQKELVDLNAKLEAEHTKWQTSLAKVEALEECLKNVKRDPNVNITQVIDVANIRAELLDAQKKYNTLKERLEVELDARKLTENQLQIATAEVEKLKQDFNETEKDKLEAQTRLEVLSNYFKDKENQLQKELSLKEAMWLKQQGETTTTVDRLTTMQEEIQSLKSQNDALRAEIEAQVAAHKAQTGTLENRAHETWLAARQSDRRYEEARAEATALRRKLTALAGGNINEANKPTAGPAGLGDDLANAPSPIHLESPGSPMLGRLPPPPFLPPPFMGPPPPFLGMPPPPFGPPGEMRPAPLGRIMSPPPPQRSGHIDYEDYLDYEGDNSWHRHHTYSPPPRTYRSLSPTDSRYNYGTERDLISTYDTETDFSPPPSPREPRRRGGGGGYGSDKGGSSRHPYSNSKKSSSGNKVPLSSGSEKSYNSSPKQGGKSKPSGGGGGGGGKSLV